MKKDDLKILPPTIALMIKDIMHRCRECPPPNWPMRAYELIDRQDLAALDKHLESSSKLQYTDGETRDYGIKDEQDDGMEFDDTVYGDLLHFLSQHIIFRLPYTRILYL